MADYYVEFSELIPNLSDREAAWLAHQLQEVVVIDGVDYPADYIAACVAPGPISWRGPRFLLGAEDYEESPEEAAFCFEFGDEGEAGDSGRYLWLYSEESANLDQVALLVQKFLRGFRPQDVWTMTYATTCSKPRCGAFGGGAGVVTADAIEWHDAELIADEARRAAAGRLSPAS